MSGRLRVGVLVALLGTLGGACQPMTPRPGMDPPRQPPPQPPPGRLALTVEGEFASTQQTYTALHDGRGRPYLYVTAGAGGLLVLDVSDPTRPRLAHTVASGAFDGRYTNNLHQAGDRLYVATGNFTALPSQRPGLAVVDVSDPANARVVGRWEHAAGSRGAHVVEVRGRYAYIGASFEGLIILDVSDPAAMRLVSQVVPDINFPTPNPGAFQRPAARGLAVVGDSLLVLTYDAGGLRLLDIRDKARPREVGRHVNPAINPRVQAQAYNNVVVDGRVAYVAVDYCGIEVLDIGNVAAVRQLAWFDPWQCAGNAAKWLTSAGHTSELVLRPDRHRLFVSAGDTQLLVLDVTDPAAPVELARHGGKGDNRVAWGLDVTASHVYLAQIRSPGGPFSSNWAGVTVLGYR